MRTNKLFLLLALLLTAATGAWAEEQVVYTLDGTQTASNTAYANAGVVNQDGITWMVTGNVNQNPWRIGGKDLSGVDRPVWSENSLDETVTKVTLEFGEANSITVNSITMTVAGDADFNNVIDSKAVTFSANNTVDVTPTEGKEWKNAYYRFVFNMSVSGSSNKYLQLKSIKFYNDPDAQQQGGSTEPVAGTFTVSMKDDVKDADKWTVKVGEGQAQALPIGGLKGDGSETVTLQYNGRLKVKGVKATSDAAPAAPAFAADEYNEASWDDTNKKVVYEKKKATTTPVAVADANTNVTWSDGWYTVSGNVTITGTVTLGADTHLILQDGATLTINGQLNCRTNSKNLYIYGQKKGDGKLNVTNNGAHAIYSKNNYHIDIHGGEVTAAATGSGSGLNTGYLAVYGGKLTATSGGSNGILFNNTIDVYDGEVEATSNATSSSKNYHGIRSSSGTDNQTLTVYGGKVTATGNGIIGEASFDYGSCFNCYVKSGTSGIKFYFSDNGTTWGDGTSYASATQVGNDDATKKRYAKAE